MFSVRTARGQRNAWRVVVECDDLHSCREMFASLSKNNPEKRFAMFRNNTKLQDTGETPIRRVYKVHPEDYARWKRKAKAEDTTVSAMIRHLMNDWSAEPIDQDDSDPDPWDQWSGLGR